MAQIDLGKIKFKWQGAYNGATAYVVDDVVESGGNSYVCILASTGNTPPNATYWELMSQKGTDGTDLTSTLTTQGDILYRDGSGLQRLGAGTSGQALITNGTGANPSWGTVSAGKILQVVSASKNDTFTSTSTSFVDVPGLTANITPSSTSNKVLVTVLLGRLATDDGGGFGAQVDRSGSSIYDLAQGNLADCFGTGGGGGMTNNDRKNDVSFMQFLDSPSSTSSLTYKIRVKRTSAGTGFINQWGLNGDQGAVSTITLMEIAV